MLRQLYFTFLSYSKIPLLKYSFLFIVVNLILFLNAVTVSFYKTGLNSLDNSALYHATSADFEIFNLGFMYFLPGLIFIIQQEEFKTNFSNRLKFYPNGWFYLFFSRFFFFYILTGIFTVLFIFALYYKYLNYIQEPEIFLWGFKLICWKISIMILVSIPYISLITFISLYTNELFVGLVIHFAVLQISFYRDFYFFPSAWTFICAQHYGIILHQTTFYKELNLGALTTSGICICLLIYSYISGFYSIKINGKYY